MRLSCTSLKCGAENPVDYCKECSHANWIVDEHLEFNPRFGFDSEKEIDWEKADKWLATFNKIDINETSFKLDQG